MIKNFCDFINESKTDAQLDKAILVIIYECLKRFDPNGGNNSDGELGKKLSKVLPIFKEEQGPDLYVNIDWRTDEPSVVGEAELLSKIPNKILDKKFQEYGLSIENLRADETIVHVADLAQDDTEKSFSKKWDPNFDLTFDEVTANVIDFYKKRESRIKELEEKLKTHLKGKKFGIS